MELVILAAGMGSRFGGLKQIEPMDDYGNFIIDYSIYDAIQAGFDSVTFIIKEEMLEDFKATIGNRIAKRINVKYAFQRLNDLPEGYECPKDRVKPWGTGHAILAAGQVVNDHFVIINADDYYGRDAFKVAANYLRSLSKDAKGLYANVVYKVCNTITENGSVKRGVCFNDERGMLTNMVESSIERNADGKIEATPVDSSISAFALKEDTPVSMNMFIFTKDILGHLKNRFAAFLDESKDDNLKCEYLIPTVVSDLITDNLATVKLLQTNSVWYGVTYKKDKDGVVKALKELTDKGEYEVGLWK